MPARAKKKPTLEDRALAALARNGVNTHLMDIVQQLGQVQASQTNIMSIITDDVQERREIRDKMETVSIRMGHVEAVVTRIEPIVTRLEIIRIEKGATRKFFGGLLKRGHAIWAGIGISISGAAAWIGHWFTSR